MAELLSTMMAHDETMIFMQVYRKNGEIWIQGTVGALQGGWEAAYGQTTHVHFNSVCRSVSEVEESQDFA